ncbi:MAG: hypothetical protein BroJett003_01110 [Planctomycetota bacterium]|nr:MAG: hypothetical protein BroJett003_01110 [Planctomycetota bacterium]
MKRSGWIVRKAGIWAVVAAAGVCVAGCRNVYEDPFVDPVSQRGAVTTASVTRISEQPGVREQRHRDHAPLKTAAPVTHVDHGPLYFEDPFEHRGSDDGRFAWTWEDYFAFAYGDGRWLVNNMFIPLSLVVDPFWTAAYTRGDRPGPSRRTPDRSAPSDWCAETDRQGTADAATPGA